MVGWCLTLLLVRVVSSEVVSAGVGRPCGLAVDDASERLFWADHQLGTVESAALDGTQRSSLVSGRDRT